MASGSLSVPPSVSACGSYDVSSVLFVLHKRVVQPDELFVLSDHRELVLLEVGQRALCGQEVHNASGDHMTMRECPH